jgi:hypothetical protein
LIWLNKSSDISLISQNKKLIITILNIDCPVCLETFAEVKRFVEKHKLNNYCVIGIGDTSNFFNREISNKKWPFAIYLDKNNYVTNDNDIRFDIYKSFLLNANKEIIFCGSPTANSLMESSYLQLLKKQ